MQWHDQAFIYLTLPGLLPQSSLVIINPPLRVVSLLSLEAGTVRMLAQVQCTASGMDVLIPLLESYPDYCPYEVLLSHLFPRPVEDWRETILEAEGAAREEVLTPLRRAIGSLYEGLHQLGLEVCSLRNIGYMVKKHALRPVPSNR